MDAAEILSSPDYLNANAATKSAIFDKHVASTPDFANANSATQSAIRARFGLENLGGRETTSVADAIPEGRARGGFKRQVGEAFTRPADTSNIPVPTMAELGQRYSDLATGAAQGVPAAIVGLPGDVISLVGRTPGLPEEVRSAMIENPIQSEAIANYIFGEPANKDIAYGRLGGGLATGFVTPGAAAKIGQLKEAADAAKMTNTARVLSGAQTVLDPVSPIVAGAVNKAATLFNGAKATTPTTNALLDRARANYRVMDDSNLAIHPDVLQSAVGDINKTLETSRYVEELDPVAKNFLKVLEERAKEPQSLTQIDALRGKARDLAAEATGGEQKVLSTISRKLDETLSGINETKLVPKDPSLPSANPTEVRDALTAARDDFRTAAKSSEIETLIHNADLSTSDNPVKALRTQFTTLAKNEDRMAQYTAAEQKVIRDIAAGNIGSSTLQGLENLMPGFSRSSMFGNFAAAAAGLLGSAVGGPVGSLAFSIPGAIGKAAERARGGQAIPAANKFAEGIRAGTVGNALAPGVVSAQDISNWMRPGLAGYNAFNNQ